MDKLKLSCIFCKTNYYFIDNGKIHYFICTECGSFHSFSEKGSLIFANSDNCQDHMKEIILTKVNLN